MANAEEITKAIGAHGMWKQRLRQAIDSGKSEFTVERVQPDNLCDFGKWLHALPAADKAGMNWKTVQELHARFHLEASRVLGLALSGQKQDAEKALANSSEFANISSNLTSAMMKWKDAHA
jgi:methyl-accepting chemotaxis protein